MPWTELVNTILWIITLAVSLLLALTVVRRQDLPARLLLGIIGALAVPQLHHTAGEGIALARALAPSPWLAWAAAVVRAAWPLDFAALTIFGCLALHLFLVFPTPSRPIRAWRWTPALFYLPGAALAAMIASQMALGAGYRPFWGLDRLGLPAHGLQLLFTAALLAIGLVRLLQAYFRCDNLLLRRQMAWLLWGVGAAAAAALLTDFGPDLLGVAAPADYVPGLQQFPTLAILGTFGLAMISYHRLDAEVVASRSLAYGLLAVAVTGVYLAIASLLGLWFAGPDARLPLRFSAILTTLLVVLVALPLRDALLSVLDRVFLRGRKNYQQLLQDFSRKLTGPVGLPRLLATVAGELEQAVHPQRLVVVLAGSDGGFRVVAGRGSRPAGAAWQEGAVFAADHWIARDLGARRRPLYLLHRLDGIPAAHHPGWAALRRLGLHVFLPMHLADRLTGWIALGPRLSDVPYGRPDLDFLAALADQSCVALENARLYQAMQQRATELAMVGMISSAISSSLDLEYVLQAIVESVPQVVGGHKSAIFELDEEGRELTLRMSKGLSQSYVENSRHIAVGKDARALAIASRQPLIVPDIEADRPLASLRALARHEGYRAVIDVPLIGRAGNLGVLSVYYRHVHAPSPGEMEVLTTFANQAAVAIENARLYAAVSRDRDRAQHRYEQTDAALARRVDELTAIEEISRQLTGTLDLRHVMDVVLDRAFQATGADRGLIALHDKAQAALEFLAQRGFPPELDSLRSGPWPDTRGVTGRVGRTGVLAVVPDVAAEPDYWSIAPLTRSLLSVPIARVGHVIGVITLESDRPAAFSAEHVRFVELLAEHAAIGIHNARLFEEVMATRDHLQAVLNSTRDAVIVIDTAGRVLLTNPRVREMFGPAAEEWLWHNNVLDAQLPAVQGLFEQFDLDGGAPGDLARRAAASPAESIDLAFNFVSGGPRCHVEGTASAVRGTLGQRIGWVAVLRDVTGQHELELFRTDLTSMVIHNLQGPLAAIISSLEMLREDYDLHAGAAGELVRIALTSSQRLYSRIESLLKIRQLEDRHVPLDLQVLPLWCIVEPVVQDFSPAAAAGGVALRTELAPDLPLVIADDEKAGRVFGNLLDNALKFTPPGGTITITAGLHAEADTLWVRCAVLDTGPGIPEAERELVFDKFWRGAHLPEGRRGGMGIGLHYCRLAVEAHGGRIWIESAPGQGSAFCFTLPVDMSSMKNRP